MTARTKVFTIFYYLWDPLEVLWFKGSIAVIPRASLLGAFQKEGKDGYS